MVEGTFPVWVIASIVDFVILIIIASTNYYLPRISKLKAQCIKDKSARQRNNMILRLRRRMDENDYPWIVFTMYAVISICFLVENHKTLLTGGFLFFKVLAGILVWLFAALVVVCFMVAFMRMLQENAIKDLKNYYFGHYGVTLVYISKTAEEEYHEFELSN